MSAPSVSRTREFAPVWEKISRRTFRSTPSASPRARPSVDVHHHVDQRLDLRGPARGPDVTARDAQRLQQRARFFDHGGIAGQDQIERPLPGLSDA
jgi:hypothetical protein